MTEGENDSHRWEGPTIGDRECIVCGETPREWVGDPCPGYYPIPNWIIGEPRRD